MMHHQKEQLMDSGKKIDELYDLIEGIEIAMFTTRRADGNLVSRPMATQARAEGADLWFVTDISSDKLDELKVDPHVNVSYYKDRSREFVSVSGTAHVTQNREKIRELWRPDWKAWFPGENPEAGTPEDPRLALIAIEAVSAQYLKIDKPQWVVLFEVARGMVTGKTPNVGEVQRVNFQVK
jgi:general stress protein 26